jgi:ribosome biogenesis GTPase
MKVRMKETPEQGWVTRIQSGFYTVHSKHGNTICNIRGKLKRTQALTDFIAVGDRVDFIHLQDGSGVIEKIHERKSALVRRDPRPKETYKQILLANPDQVVIVFACAQPEPHLRMLDRFLVVTEKQQLPVIIVANKIDLVGKNAARKIFGLYPKLGYTVLYTSVSENIGIRMLKDRLKNKISALAGPSGVGKTSLLNEIQPGLGLHVREVNPVTEKGKHTTNVREMFPLEGGGFIADLPGLRSLALWDTQPEELDGYFPEIRPLVQDCQFSDCTHQHEPGCAVIKAVQEGTIHPSRYESYLRMRNSED